MPYMIIKTLLFPAIIALCSFQACTTMQKNGAADEQTMNGMISSQQISNERIDREETYEMYFKPEKPVSCLKISFSARYLDQGISPKYRSMKIYFIVERMVDIAKYGKNLGRYNYYELARNYDKNWEYSREVTICSQENDPLEKIEPNALYRIRFTSFSTVKFEYSVTFKSGVKIMASEKISELQEKK
ncbi:MAG TPA: hypothetical protein PK926_08345 [Spirochaetota bacterium]|nr:hypothetical protein [Spirochaetota bacterium]HPI89838.1 hypothetical protein [Spirochaetota bacterium]HPR48649.1 hypothetical protein [Spirochaetota bacterium]